MEKNSILNLTIFICGASRFIYVMFGIVLLVFFVHIQVNPDFYDSFYWKESVEDNTIPNIIHSKIQSYDEVDWTKSPKTHAINSITTFSLYYTFFQLMAILTLFYLSIFEFQKVVESVKNLKTFQERNVKSFRRIGNYFLAVYLLSIYSYVAFADDFTTEIELEFVSIFIILIVFVLAEIFKEGNKLQEENQLTV